MNIAEFWNEYKSQNPAVGDKSLEFWQSVHEKVFTMELAELGMQFDKSMPVVLETFCVVYPQGERIVSIGTHVEPFAG